MKRQQYMSAIGAFIIGLAAFSAQADELKCEGPFARDSSHASLEKIFGASQVAKGVVHVEADELKASIVFPKDADRRLEIVWWDEKALKRPASIQVEGSGWTGPKAIRVGMKISEVEVLNGKPFLLYGFGWDDGGTSADWRGGAFADVPGGCNLIVVFALDKNVSEDAFMKAVGDKKFLSSSKEIKAVSPKVRRIGFAYPR